MVEAVKLPLSCCVFSGSVGKFDYCLQPNGRTCLPTKSSKPKQKAPLLSTERAEEVCILSFQDYINVKVILKDLTGKIFGFSGHARQT